MSAADPELTRLLIQELSRHLITLSAEPPDHEACRRAVHALKGSAGLAGEPELSTSLQRLERRVRDGDELAMQEARDLVRASVERLTTGKSVAPPAVQWPVPPPDLVPVAIDAVMREQYSAEITDRLRGIDDSLESRGDAIEAAAAAYRHVHTMKGAASAVGDELTSWFCHGLEERLKGATYRDAAVSALQELARWRGVLGALLEDPAAALRTLRGGGTRPSAVPSQRGTMRPGEDADDATIRVDVGSVERLMANVARISLSREPIARHAELARAAADRMRRLEARLAEALRLIGPPRPWGAPAAALQRIVQVSNELSAASDALERAFYTMHSSDVALRDDVIEATRELSAMRQTPLRRLFSRLAGAVAAEARRTQREVVVQMRGADETIDRRIAELLSEPCLQIARNSVAHGIELPQDRMAAGKSPVGTITLSARRSMHRIVISIEDDGAGVDVSEVRRRAIDSGAVAPELAEAADDDTLLALLFLPGLSTRDSSDLLAGRGIGLDIALGSIQRLGGALRLASRKGAGFSTRVEIPVETALASVIWVEAAGTSYAIPTASAARVHLVASRATVAPHLATCIEGRVNDIAAYALELDLEDPGDDPRPVLVGVDAVGRTEEVLIRPLTSLVASMGPYAGGIVREDGTLRLAIDVYALASRARALGRVPEAAVSSVGSTRPPPRGP